VTGKVKRSKEACKEACKEEVPYDLHHKHGIGYFDKVFPIMRAHLCLEYIITRTTMPLRNTSSTENILKTLFDI